MLNIFCIKSIHKCEKRSNDKKGACRNTFQEDEIKQKNCAYSISNSTDKGKKTNYFKVKKKGKETG